MTRRTVIENKISAAQKYLALLKEYQRHSRNEIEHDTTIRGAVERYLYLAIQAAIDLAEAIIAYRELRKPTTMGEIFTILHEAKIVPAPLAERLIKMTGFRNVIAHDYEKINYDIVYDVLTKRLGDIEEFLRIAAALR